MQSSGDGAGVCIGWSGWTRWGLSVAAEGEASTAALMVAPLDRLQESTKSAANARIKNVFLLCIVTLPFPENKKRPRDYSGGALLVQFIELDCPLTRMI